MATKSYTEYVEEPPEWWTGSFDDYTLSPASAFLSEAVHTADAVNQCKRKFSKKQDGNYTKDSKDSLFRIGAAALSSIMGYFETFERLLFAGSVEAMRFIPTFNTAQFCKKLEKDFSLTVGLSHLVALRGESVPIGRLISDNLSGWHNPERVSGYFGAILPDIEFFSKRDARELEVLWQLRHSIVHTGGWLTHADAQKVSGLSVLAGRPILLSETFTEAVARRLHGVVKRSTQRFGNRFSERLGNDLAQGDRDSVKALFTVESPRQSWLEAS